MRRWTLHLLTVSFLVGLPVAPVAAKRERPPAIIEREDGKYLRLEIEDDPKAQAWLYRTVTGDEDDDGNPTKPVELVVALHGAGGNPKNFVLPLLMMRRDCWCLAVAGSQTVHTERGRGYDWRGSDVETVLTFVRHVLAEYPIRKDRVIVWGHSAGGRMTLAALGEAPELFAGGLTTAAPATPDGRHASKRLCVFLGTEDPCWSGAGAVRSYVARLAKKRGGGACAFFAVEDLGHDIPYDDYVGLGFDWILQGRARGGEAVVPRRSRGSDGEYRHILVRFKGAEGAEEVTRSRRKAEKLLTDVAAALDEGRAFFPFEASRHSEDEDTAGCGGGIDADDLRGRFLPTLPELAPGTVSPILASAKGLHLVTRSVEEDE